MKVTVTTDDPGVTLTGHLDENVKFADLFRAGAGTFAGVLVREIKSGKSFCEIQKMCEEIYSTTIDPRQWSHPPGFRG